jgi:hypothetical protein
MEPIKTLASILVEIKKDVLNELDFVERYVMLSIIIAILIYGLQKLLFVAYTRNRRNEPRYILLD